DRGDVLADLLGAAVEVAEVRGDFGDDLAVGPQHEPQHPVGAGVLRTHVDEHLVGPDVELDDGRVGLFGGHGFRAPWRAAAGGCTLNVPDAPRDVFRPATESRPTPGTGQLFFAPAATHPLISSISFSSSELLGGICLAPLPTSDLTSRLWSG